MDLMIILSILYLLYIKDQNMKNQVEAQGKEYNRADAMLELGKDLLNEVPKSFKLPVIKPENIEEQAKKSKILQKLGIGKIYDTICKDAEKMLKDAKITDRDDVKKILHLASTDGNMATLKNTIQREVGKEIKSLFSGAAGVMNNTIALVTGSKEHERYAKNQLKKFQHEIKSIDKQGKIEELTKDYENYFEKKLHSFLENYTGHFGRKLRPLVENYAGRFEKSVQNRAKELNDGLGAGGQDMLQSIVAGILGQGMGQVLNMK